MKKFLMPLSSVLTLALLITGTVCAAETALTKREQVKADVMREVGKDLSASHDVKARLESRRCIDGRAVKDFQGDIVEFWANLECFYCQISQPVIAQRANPGICIVVRHIPTPEYGESMKKALSYEALHEFSPNAANRFWETVEPKTHLAIPMPMESAFLAAAQDASIPSDKLSAMLTGTASQTVSADLQDAQGRIFSTPTYVLAGIRFGSCDFKADELPAALELAKKARAEDEKAKARIVEVITNGRMGEKML